MDRSWIYGSDCDVSCIIQREFLISDIIESDDHHKISYASIVGRLKLDGQAAQRSEEKRPEVIARPCNRALTI